MELFFELDELDVGAWGTGVGFPGGVDALFDGVGVSDGVEGSVQHDGRFLCLGDLYLGRSLTV